MDRYVYPAIFEMNSDGVSVEFPDLAGALTCGKDEIEALDMARDCLGLHLYGMERDQDEIPAPSNFGDIKISSNQSKVLVEVWMPLYRQEIEEKATKVTTTIPQWLKVLADANKINYSAILQVGIKNKLGIKSRD